MADIRALLAYFNGRLEEDWAEKRNGKEIAVDRQKLIDLLGEVDAMLAVLSAQNRPRTLG
jgi:hypothetical protein